MGSLSNRLQRIESESKMQGPAGPSVIHRHIYDVGAPAPSPGPAMILIGPMASQSITPNNGETCDEFEARVAEIMAASKAKPKGGAA